MYVFTAIIGMMATLAIPVLSRALLERIPPGAGYGYDEASFHGNESTLPVGPHIMTRLRSAKVTPGFTCNFYNNTVCSHQHGPDEFINLPGFKGSLPFTASCTYCFVTNPRDTSIG